MGPCQESFNRVDKRESKGSEGVHGRLPQNAPLWAGDYFKPKTIEAQRTQEECFLSILTVKKNSDREPVPGRELLPEIIFTSERFISMAGQTSVYQTLALPVFLRIVILPFVVSDSYPLLLSSRGWRMTFKCLTIKEPHIFGVPVRTKLIFFSCC